MTSEEKRHQKPECLGYTTQALPLQRDTPLLAGLDKKPLRNTDGKQITLPAGSKVGFRCMPDGEHAVIRLNRLGKESSLWAVVKMDDINWNGVDRSKVPGAITPGKKIRCPRPSCPQLMMTSSPARSRG